jgi:exodeoxyribonuclease-3
MEFLQFFYDYIKKLQQINLPLIICGDYNIAHQPIDIHDPKSNAKSTGFLPEERQWLTDFLALELADAYRHLHPTAAHNYSWWSTRFKTVRLQNKGWRIDYQVISQSLLPHLHQAYMLPHAQQSDHCAVVVQLQNL